MPELPARQYKGGRPGPFKGLRPKLEKNPGEWFPMTDPAFPSQIRHYYAKRYSPEFEFAARGGTVYARFVGESA